VVLEISVDDLLLVFQLYGLAIGLSSISIHVYDVQVNSGCLESFTCRWNGMLLRLLFLLLWFVWDDLLDLEAVHGLVFWWHELLE
jgi:hypothetical protein